jgi:hypothetical protein
MKGKSNGLGDFLQSFRGNNGDQWPDFSFGNGLDMIQIHGAVHRHPLSSGQEGFTPPTPVPFPRFQIPVFILYPNVCQRKEPRPNKSLTGAILLAIS